MWSALNNHARHRRDVRSNLNASATVSECRHGAIQPGHDVGGRQSGALLSWAATISGAGDGGGAAISTGGIARSIRVRTTTGALAQRSSRLALRAFQVLQRCVVQQHWHSDLPLNTAGARECALCTL